MITRETYKRALVAAVEEIAKKQQQEVIFAAPLAVRVLASLKNELGEARMRELAETLGVKAVKLTGELFAEILYPSYPVKDRTQLKFRHFLEAFPDTVEVVERPNGDMVRLLGRHAEDAGDLNRRYRQLLLETLHRLLNEHKVETIPVNQLAIWMKKRMPAFNASHLGYSSLSEWLAKVPEVILTNDKGVTRVGSAGNAPIVTDTRAPARPAYFLVDSADLHSMMHEILGTKPTQGQLPDWARVLQYFRDRWSHFDWRSRYFMALTPAEHQTMQGLFSYLEGVGFKVVKINLKDEGLSFDEMRIARNQTTAEAVVKALRFIREEGQPSAVLVLSHDALIANGLLELLKARNLANNIGMIGFTEKMPEEVASLRVNGLISIDLERHCNAFKKPLNRSLGYDLDEMSAREIL